MALPQVSLHQTAKYSLALDQKITCEKRIVGQNIATPHLGLGAASFAGGNCVHHQAFLSRVRVVENRSGQTSFVSLIGTNKLFRRGEVYITRSYMREILVPMSELSVSDDLRLVVKAIEEACS